MFGKEGMKMRKRDVKFRISGRSYGPATALRLRDDCMHCPRLNNAQKQYVDTNEIDFQVAVLDSICSIAFNSH